MKAAFLGLLATVSLGTYAHAQAATESLDQAADQAQLATPIDAEHVDLDKGLFYDDGQARPDSELMLRPGSRPGGGGGMRPSPRPPGGGGGGGMRPAPRPRPPGGGGGMRPAPRPRPPGGGGTRPAPGRPGQPGHQPRPPGGARPGQPGHQPRPPGGARPGQPGHGRPPGRPAPRPPGGGHYGPGHHGGWGHGWHPGRGPYTHNPRWHNGYRWRRDYHPHWWYAGVSFPGYFWDVDAPAGYYQCIAYDRGGYDATPFVGFGPDVDEAAFNAIEACGGERDCYIPPGYCQLR